MGSKKGARMWDFKMQAKRTAGQRGAVAIIGMAVAIFAVTLMVVVLGYGILVNQQQKLQNAADALAMNWGLQLVQTEQTGTSRPPPLFNQEQWLAANGVGSLASSMYRMSLPATLASTADRWTENYMPATAWVHIAKPPDEWPVLSTWANLGDGHALPGLAAASRMRVKQVQLGYPQLVRERVILALDFSRTMSLEYTGGNASLTGRPAAEVVKKAANDIINHYKNLISIGLYVFSDGRPNNDQRINPIAINTTKDPIKQSAIDDQSAQIRGAVQSQTVKGDGTDIGQALKTAQNMLTGSVTQNDPRANLSQGRVILITDGEPDVVDGSGGGTSQDDNIRRGREAATTAMRQLWDNGGAGNPGSSSVMFIQREKDPPAVDGMSTAQFLRSLVRNGAGVVGDGNNFLADGGDPGAISRFIESGLSLQPRCYFRPLEQMPDFSAIGENAAKLLLPSVENEKAEQIYAYFVADATSGREVAFPIKNIFIDDFSGYTRWQSGHGAITEARTQEVPPAELQNRENFGLYYDSRTHVTTIGGMLCAAMSGPKNRLDHRMRIRLRWGPPRPVYSNVDRRDQDTIEKF